MADDTANRAASDVAALYQRWSADVHSYAFRLLGSQEVADDVTQDVFVSALRHGHNRSADVPVQVWLYRVATNRCFDRLRRRNLLSWLPLAAWHESDGAADPVGDAAATTDAVHQALRRLSARDAAILVLFAAQGLDYKEIATTLGISAGAAASALTRARERFARAYEALGEPCPYPVARREGR